MTLTIAGILMAVAAPNMFKFVASNRLASQVNELIGDINLARSEAIKRSTTSGICASDTGTSCAGGDWGEGWIVYAVEGAVTTVIKSHEKLTGKNSVTSSGTTLSFARSGFQPAGAADFTLTLCDPKLKQSRTVTISLTGRPNLTEGTC